MDDVGFREKINCVKITQNIRQAAHSELAKNSAKLLSANVIAQAIGLIVYPILTRLYAPDDFGLLNLFLSIGGILTLFATAEYHYAIVLPKAENKANACFQVGFGILCAVTLICALTTPFSESISALFKAPDLSKWYFLLPIFVFLMGFWNLLNYWFIRQKKFNRISGFQLSQNTLNALAKIGFGYAGFLRGGMIVSVVLAPFIAIIISILGSFKKLKSVLTIDKKICKEVAREYANFPKFSLFSSLINNISNNLPILLLTPFFGLTEIGFWGMALTLSFTPISTISRSLYQVFYQRTAEQVQNRLSIKNFFRKFISNTLLLTIPSFTLLYFILPWLTEFLLGAGWEVTGEYIRIMLPWLIITIITGPICYLSNIFKKQRKALFYEIIRFCARILGLFIGIYFNNFTIAIMGYCIGTTLILIIQMCWYLRLISAYEKNIA